MADTERLTRLAELLDRVPHSAPVSFDLSSWAMKSDCGTTACACGHAALDPWFQSQGFYLKDDLGKKILTVADLGKVTQYPDITYDGFTDWDAVEVFFDLLEDHCEHLFAGWRYEGVATPADVASRIREYLALDRGMTE